MRLRDVHIDDFRAFEDADVSLPRNGLVLVAGANNAGKSALLSALDVVAGDMGDAVSVVHAGSAGHARVMATFDLDDAERESVLRNAADGAELLAGGALGRLQFVFEESGGDGPKLVEVLGGWPSGSLVPLVRERAHTAHPQPGLFIWETIGAFSPGQAERESRDVLASRDYSMGRRWLDFLVPSEAGLAPIWALLAAWRSRFYHFRPLRPGTQRSQGVTSPEKMDPAGSSLAGVLHYLATDNRARFEEARAIIAEIVPDIGRLEVRTGGERLRVVFENSSGDLNLKDLGTGVEQLLMTIVVGLTESPPFTLLIEEPETNLHPAAQRALLGLLQGWAVDRLIVAATHSAVMLDWSPGGDRLWHVTREQGTSRVAQLDADPLPLLNSLGVRLSDVLSADRVLVLEGQSDQDVLAVWFPTVLRNPRVAVLDGEGGDSAQHADRLAAWLAGTDRAGLKRVLYLRDRDELSPQMLDRLSKSEAVHVLARRELENYLLDPPAVAAVIATLLPEGAPLPAPADVAGIMAQAAKGLSHRIVINRVARQVVPPRLLMSSSLRKELAAAGSDLAQFTAAVTGRLMTPEDLTAQIAAAWAEADADVAKQDDEQLLQIAPGEEILDAVFMHYAGRHYHKRVHGAAIAAAMPRPGELTDLFAEFMSE